jgi:membrane protein
MASSKPAKCQPADSLWKLGGLSLRHLSTNVIHRIREDNFIGRTSELAFDFLFALFPLVLFLLTLIGLFASQSSELQTNLLSYFSDYLPRGAFLLLKQTTTELAVNAGGGKLTIGLLVALVFASGGASSMIGALNLAYRVRETRSWFRVRAIALGLTVAISVLLISAMFLVLISGDGIYWLGTRLHMTPFTVVIWGALQWPLTMLFVFLSYSLIYFWGPCFPKRRWHWLTPGSATGVLLWLVASLGFRIYLYFFDSYSFIYGSLGAVMILLCWLYMTAFAFLVGAEINAEIELAALLRREDTQEKVSNP